MNLIFVFLLLFAPDMGSKFVIVIIGIYALIAGALLITLGVQVKSLAKEVGKELED